MEPPFLFGDAVKGDYFTDREEELRTLTLDLASGQNLLLFSPRRYGKTSLMIRVLENLKAKGIVGIYVDLFRATSLQNFGKIYADAITRATASKIEEAVQFVKEHFPAIVPRIVVRGQESTEFELDFEAPRRDLEKWLDEIYDLPQKIAERKKKRLVVVFDEFQEAAALGTGDIVERNLRARIQHHDRVAYVFMGSKRHLSDELFQDKTKPLYRIAKSMPLGKIPEPKLGAFIRSRFRSVKISVSSEDVAQILRRTGCHPYYTQQLCHEIYNAVVPGKKVSEAAIQKAAEQCIQTQSYAYITIWEGLAGKQRELATALSKTPGGNVYSQDFIARHDLGSPSSIQTALEALEKKGILERENGSYCLSDVLFAEWIRRKIA